jgi:carbon-monoxide dehydrogenase medium subunit
MYEFNYHRPASLDEAKQILAANAEAKIIAGGMTLLPTMKLRLAQPSDLVDLSAIDGLDAISDAGSAIDIGAMARHADAFAPRSPHLPILPMPSAMRRCATAAPSVARSPTVIRLRTIRRPSWP